MKHILIFILCIFLLNSCNSSHLEDAIGLAQGIPRKTIDTNLMGVNAFMNDSRFSSPRAQFQELRDILRLKYVRMLVNWNDGVQASPEAQPDFSWSDSVIGDIPEGIDALIIINGLPSWMSDSSYWINGNPRKTFIERWFKPIVARYSNNPHIVGWQVWNEPNMQSNPENALLGFNNPENYVEMLGLAYSVAKDLSPSKLVINAATTAINQNFPETRDYNRAMRDAGADNFVDVWAIHYYGKQFENIVREGGVADFCNGLNKEIWITESGAMGVNEQLAYVEQAWPYLSEKIDRLGRIYYYQFTEASSPESTYGLRNLSSTASLSDLYIWLRDRG
ncbi:MAG: cellulase family glycosylhydrolase [SAR324 cluster bacterium]|uniref:Cellulase family glycosylhydrolase n=1 Tax=SAR324 cluster bacterium TaxID=2024889 RepID=A0A7X9FV18_9DELT|nr:cellulase family glycosylhydrolase [SAR324 cluster bacterium]